MEDRIQKILNCLLGFCSGIVISSIWILDTETYKNIIPIILLIIIAKFMIYDNYKK